MRLEHEHLQSGRMTNAVVAAISLKESCDEGCISLQVSQNAVHFANLLGGESLKPREIEVEIGGEMMLQRSTKVEVRLSDIEYHRLNRLVDLSGLDKSKFIRKALFDDGKMIIMDRSLIYDLYNEVNRIGNNINQIARMANIEKRISVDQITDVYLMLDEIRKLVDYKLRGIERK